MAQGLIGPRHEIGTFHPLLGPTKDAYGVPARLQNTPQDVPEWEKKNNSRRPMSGS